MRVLLKAMSESTSDLAQYNFLHRIDLAASDSQAAFCCAGHVPITADSSFDTIKDDIRDRQLTSAPVVIRWDRKDGKTISKLILPVARERGPGEGPPSKKQKADSDGLSTENHAAIQDLLNDCALASSGKDGKDVLDDSYRKALKLDSDQFSTNFNPYDVGIIGAIAQTLLPGLAKPITAKSQERTFAECLGVVAELYKLNVYSAPSGNFKPHVDTPRGVAQFGTLVVCLPYRHDGGALRIAHCGQKTIYAWGNQDGIIQWAAFYSDCEHAVYKVTAGHRITLTYNLYAHEQLGGGFRSPSTIDMDSFTLYRNVKDALASPDFLPKGGTLGFHCVHAYAHANDSLVGNVAVRCLNLSVRMRAVMEG
ncbi:hypothetical protein XANCAGTX0491_008033 [Xanthoria calcicola]